MRRSSADPSSASGLRTTAASRAWENSRPIAAPICATSLAGPSRSSRAISDACRLAGTARAGDGIAAAVRCAAPSLSASSTALVISSTNRGMPSVRSMMSCRMFAGSSLLPTTRSIMASMSRCASRLMVRAVTYGRPIQGGSNSGRNVTISSTRKAAYPVHDPTKQFQARGVGPMRILEDHQHRTLARQRLDLGNERFHRSLSALLRGKFERGIASVVRQRQHLGKECRVLRRGRGLRQHRVELVELRLRGVVVHKSGGAFHLADDRIKRAVGVLRRAEIAQARVRLAGEAFQQRRREPRLADTGLAGEQHHLTFAGLCLRPAPQQQFEFFFPTDERGQAARVQRLEAALHRSSAAAPPRLAPARRCP